MCTPAPCLLLSTRQPARYRLRMVTWPHRLRPLHHLWAYSHAWRRLERTAPGHRYGPRYDGIEGKGRVGVFGSVAACCTCNCCRHRQICPTQCFSHAHAADLSSGNNAGPTVAGSPVACFRCVGVCVSLLHDRHVARAEQWSQMHMQAAQDGFATAIPAGYTQSAFPLEYYFELRARDGAAWLYPAFSSTLSNQPC